MRWTSIIVMLILLGCAAQEQLFAPDTLPQIVLQDPLPAYTADGGDARIKVKLLINKRGDVDSAIFVRATADREWDALVCRAMLRWKFTPATVKGTPVRLWIEVPVIIRAREPEMIGLAEIVCASFNTADSLYVLLRSGADFADVARTHSNSESAGRGGNLGTVNARRYPDEVQQVLSGLKEGEISGPIRLGNQYVIFKRLPIAL